MVVGLVHLKLVIGCICNKPKLPKRVIQYPRIIGTPALVLAGYLFFGRLNNLEHFAIPLLSRFTNRQDRDRR